MSAQRTQNRYHAPMPEPTEQQWVDPIGDAVAGDVARGLADDPAFREAWERMEPFSAIARMTAQRRSALGLSQRDLARRMGTSHSAIARLESGTHPVTVTTLQRLAQALDMRLVIGFETGPADDPVRDIAAV